MFSLFLLDDYQKANSLCIAKEQFSGKNRWSLWENSAPQEGELLHPFGILRGGQAASILGTRIGN